MWPHTILAQGMDAINEVMSGMQDAEIVAVPRAFLLGPGRPCTGHVDGHKSADDPEGWADDVRSVAPNSNCGLILLYDR